MKKFLVLFAVILTLSVSAREFKDVISAQAAQVNRVNNDDMSMELPRFVFSHTNTKVTIRFKNPIHDKLISNGYKLNFIVNGSDQLVAFDQAGVGSFTHTFKKDDQLNIFFEDASFNQEISVISIWYMVLPLFGLLLFLGYRLAFSRKNMTLITNREVIEQANTSRKAGSLKLVKEEEEVLA